MRARSLVAAYIGAMLTMLAVDALWLGVLMGPTYQAWLGELLLATPRWGPAAAFYLLYATGVTVFAVAPALRLQRWQRAAALGTLLGLVAYGTYDLSNFATLKDWPLALTLVDLAWGGVLSGISACAGYLCGKRWA